MKKRETRIQDDIDEVTEVLPTVFSITAYGADFPVDGLVKRLRDGDIVIPTFSSEPEEGQSVVSFQREYVWKKPQADRFVESLLLGLPVPGIFLVREANNKFMVLDGQQRLRTLQAYYDGVLQGREFVLENVLKVWKGRAYRALDAEDRRRLDNSIIHATVVRQDEPTEDQSSIYLIFERLNSTGTILHGPFAKLLKELNELPDWRAMVGPKSARMKDVELILRFFALLDRSDRYARPMKGFLNGYMGAHRHADERRQAELRAMFLQTTAAIRSGIGQRAFRLKTVVNAAVVDSVMVGVAKRLQKGTLTDPSALRARYDTLMNDGEYLRAVTRSTADEENVKTRLARATEGFSVVP